MRRHRLTLSVLVLLLAAAYGLAYQTSQSLVDGSASRDLSFSYKFEHPRFDIRVIEIDLDSNGAGELRFTRGTSDEILDCKVKLFPATIARIRNLFEASGLLASVIDYQDKKDFSHMGWVTLVARQGALERKTRFNFTTNVHMKALQEIFRAIASQEISLFDMENAERYQPLDLPKQIEILERDLKLERIAEPERLLAALNEIAGDDFQPLIARNHAKRIIEAIKKGKFKSPVKK
ncbi:MAG: hypothetical protein AABO57_04910 [Acidobacteriota bacterium]